MGAITVYSQLTLLEIAKRSHNDNLITIAEVLNKDNPILQHAPWIEANDVWANVSSQRTSLPSAQWRKLNAGVGYSASTTRQITDSIGMLEIFSKADKDLIDKSPNPSATRFSEEVAFLEGISQQQATATFYGNSATDPEQITGLAPRMNALADANTHTCSGTGDDLTSIYIVQWGPESVFFTYPRGSAIGIQTKDLGVQLVADPADATKSYLAYVSHYKLDFGLVVKNPRCIQRVCNIESAGTTNILDEDLLITAINEMPNGGSGAVIYCNKTLRTQMQIILKDKTSVNFTRDQGLDGGGPVDRFMGLPIFKCDAIVNTESALT